MLADGLEEERLLSKIEEFDWSFPFDRKWSDYSIFFSFVCFICTLC